MSTVLLLIPLISAFIGCPTNWIAIKMLFHPKQPTRILFFTIQGIFPKRQQQFAEKLGKLVSAELISFSDIEQKLTHPDNLKKLMPLVDQKVDDFLRVKLSDVFPIISMFIGENTIQQLKGIFMNELEEILPELIRNYVRNLESQLDLEQIVVEKVSRFSSDKIESLLNQIMSTEFRFIEIIGGILGFLIGIIQILITLISQ